MAKSPRFQAEEVAPALGVATVEFLGGGAFGDTWRVGDRAVKIICDDKYPADRVAREVGGLSRVDSPHVVKLYDAGAVHLGGMNRPALTFEYVPGGDLDQKVSSEIRPSNEEAAALLRGLLTGLSDLHCAEGTVHRDIKPENIALRGGSWAEPVILDLGLAKAMTEETQTVYPAMLGTWLWASPEQLEHKPGRKQSDVFSVGVTVRYAITGEHPFIEDWRSITSLDEVTSAIAAGPKQLPDSVHASLKTVLDRMVQPIQNERGSAASNLRLLGDAA
ncbi:serine/threonine-protein kinase [Nocardia sp. NPDC052254]|uniref:serine/threonine-protein kinase n=1 Tax=Nocardia sp. NPDC052254 TaxID=3155681 RepID=UPI00341DDD1E